MTVLDYARTYVAAGISVLPLRLDGTKGPAIISWKELQSRIATDAELSEWFGDDDAGIGVITGKVSGNLEVIDFDMPTLIWPTLSMVPSSLMKKLSIYETPGGWHVAYRCDDICGNTKMAMWEPIHTLRRGKCYGPADYLGKGPRIESRGEGGYIVAEGSPFAVHDTGIPYCHYFGPRLECVETITPDERKALWQACNQFDLSDQRQVQTEIRITQLKSNPAEVDLEKPWDWFDRVGTWDGILLPLGWSKCGDDAYTRPGKKFGVSASVGDNNGIELLKIWSTSVAGSDYKALGKFNALAELKFGGDTREAAKYVSELMKGKR